MSGEFQMGDSEDRAFRFVGQALDFPAVGEDDLLDDGQPQAGALFLSGKIRFEDFRAVFGRNTWAVIADFEHCLRSIAFFR